MADSATVATKFAQIEQYYGELREKQASLSRDVFLDDTTEQRAVERTFENAISACTDPTCGSFEQTAAKLIEG